MNLDEKYPNMKSETKQLICELKKAFEEVEQAQDALYDVCRKHESLCRKIVTDLLHDVPKLKNSAIEKRKEQMDGMPPLFEGFWADPRMIEYLWDYVVDRFDLWDLIKEEHASA